MRSSGGRLTVALGATARTIPRPVAAIATLAATPALVVAATGKHDFGGALSAASVIAGVGAGYAADDPAAPTLAPSPTTLATRRALRGLLISTVLLAGWAAALLIAHRNGLRPPATAALAAELCAAAALSAAVASRARTDAPVSVGASAAAVALLGVITTSALAYRWHELPALGRGPVHERWWLVAALGMAVAAWSSRDPATSPFTGANGRRRGPPAATES